MNDAMLEPVESGKGWPHLHLLADKIPKGPGSSRPLHFQRWRCCAPVCNKLGTYLQCNVADELLQVPSSSASHHSAGLGLNPASHLAARHRFLCHLEHDRYPMQGTAKPRQQFAGARQIGSMVRSICRRNKVYQVVIMNNRVVLCC